MGGSVSSQTAGPDGKIKNTDLKNFGLINLSSESDTNLNLVEIATRAGVAIVVLYLLSWYCQRRKQRKLEQITHALRSVRVEPEMGRCPIFAPERAPTNSVLARPPPPPAYPSFAKTPAEEIGAAVMSPYA